jgi:hypothetical protein
VDEPGLDPHRPPRDRAGILNRTHAAVLLERVTEGLHEIAITGASRFYAQLTNALTPGR